MKCSGCGAELENCPKCGSPLFYDGTNILKHVEPRIIGKEKIGFFRKYEQAIYCNDKSRFVYHFLTKDGKLNLCR